jgi:hypothetical protein
VTHEDRPSRIFPLLVAAWCSLLFSNTAYPQIDSTRLEFYPLHIGDLWQWRNEQGLLGTWKITKDTVLANGRTYFRFQGSGYAAPRTNFAGFVCIDSLLGFRHSSGTHVAIVLMRPIFTDSARAKEPSGISVGIPQRHSSRITF